MARGDVDCPHEGFMCEPRAESSFTRGAPEPLPMRPVGTGMHRSRGPPLCYLGGGREARLRRRRAASTTPCSPSWAGRAKLGQTRLPQQLKHGPMREVSGRVSLRISVEYWLDNAHPNIRLLAHPSLVDIPPASP